MYNSSSSGPLQEGNKTVLTEVVMYHVYSAGRKVNIYHFFNPRITQLVQDDVDMSSSDGNEIQVNFAYDSVYTELGVDMASINNRMIDIQGGSGAVYKMRSVGTIEEAGTAPQAYSASQTVPAQPSCDPANKINTSLPGTAASNRDIAPTGPINNRAEQVV